MKSLFLICFGFMTFGSLAHGACNTSPYWSNNYDEKIANGVCLSINHAAGADKSIMIDTDAYGDFDRVWVEIYDWNNDAKTDWIRISNYSKKYTFGANDIAFYHGRGELEHMLAQYGTHLEGQKSLKIEANEYGTSSYDGSYNGMKFKKVDSGVIRRLFALADRMMAFEAKDGKTFKAEYGKQIIHVLNRDVESYPARWTY